MSKRSVNHLSANQEKLPPKVAFALDKLKRGGRYPYLDHDKLVRKAYNLTDPDYIRGVFNYLFDSVGKLMKELTCQNDHELLRTLELEEAHDKAKHGVAQACHLPIRLLLSKLRWSMPTFINRFSSLLSLEYGALHAALQVGEIVIEWGRGSIVDPRPVDDVHMANREFQAQIDNQGQWFQRAHQFTRDMSLADRQHNSEEKMNVLTQSVAEKKQLIENLVTVIVDYNGTKEYSVFKCNCQHFVHDALTALRIENTPQFSGPLQDYFKHLKIGAQSIPRDLDTHEKLDKYVTENQDKLSQHDMEYLLCQYFKHHMTEMEKDLNDWACTLETCQAGLLEQRIKEETLVFNRFKKKKDKREQFVLRHADQKVLDALEEEEGTSDEDRSGSGSSDEDIELPQELAGRICLQKQRSLLNKFSGYRENVATKLKNHPFYSRKLEAKQIDFLSEREKFREQYISDVIDGPSEKVVLQISFDSEAEVAQTIPREEAKRRQKQRFDKLFEFPIKLCLYVSQGDAQTLKFRQIENAPMKAGLIVGEYFYEWDKTGLVFPTKASDVLSSRPTLQVGLLKQSEWFTYVSKQKQEVDSAIECLDHGSLITQAFEITARKDQVMFALIDQVMDYNRHYEYHHRNCNDRFFVLEAMKALGIKTPFSILSTLKRHMKGLRQPRKVKRLDSHPELDSRLLELDRNTGLANLSKQEVIFLASHHFMFHLKDWMDQNCPDSWTCTLDTCQLTFLQRIYDAM